MLKKEIKKKNLIEILGLESLSPDTQVEVVDSATTVIEKRCLNTVLESLDEKEKKQFIKMLDKENPEEVSEFFREKNIDLQGILKEEVLRFKEEVAEEFQR